MNSKSFRADWILRGNSPPLKDAIVEIGDGKVQSVAPAIAHRGTVPIDLGHSVIIPGLVNAHTHLEFCDLSHPLGVSGMEFPSWILEVVGHRIQQSNQPHQPEKADILRDGINELDGAGVVLTGEIASAPFSLDSYKHKSKPVTVFLERLGRDPKLLDDRINQLLDEVNGFSESSPHVQLGISPHAPYSVHPRMLERLVDLSVERNLPVAMHLAETREELQLLASVDGPFVAALEKLGAWFPETYTPGERPLEYLKTLSRAPKSLVIHGNYLDDEEHKFIAGHRDRMSVVFCPRTHRYFEHSEYPLQRMLDLGINVAVGTDSRASNPDLCLLRELQLIARTFPAIEPSDILKMGTESGAKALGRESHYGTLAVGASADATVIHSDEPLDSPFDFLYADSVRASLLA